FDYVKAETSAVAGRHCGWRLSGSEEVGSRRLWRRLSGRGREPAPGCGEGVPAGIAGRTLTWRTDAARQAREAAAVPAWPEELLRRRPFALADQPPERGLGAEFL